MQQDAKRVMEGSGRSTPLMGILLSGFYQIAMRRAKYRNTKVKTDVWVFDSAKEYRRYNELMILVRCKRIQDLKWQVPFVLQEKFTHQWTNYQAIEYVADFVYLEDWQTVVEDVKSAITKKIPVYIIKKKLLLRKFPSIIFKET